MLVEGNRASETVKTDDFPPVIAAENGWFKAELGHLSGHRQSDNRILDPFVR